MNVRHTSIQLAADYTMPADRLFEDFATTIVGTYATLDFLNCAGAFGGDDSVPSWVPRWSARRAYRPFLHIARFTAGLLPTDNVDFEIPRIDNRVLHCSGVVVNTIATIMPALGSSLDISQVREYLRIWVAFINAQGIAIETTQALRSVATTLTADYTFLSISRFMHQLETSTEDEEQDIEDAVDELRDCAAQGLSEIISGECNILESRLAYQFASVLCRTMAGRSLFVTTEGHFGIGPGGCRSGDEVVVLITARTPFVLRAERNQADSHRVIGDAFVHTMMRRETLTQQAQPARRVRIV